MIDNAAVVVSRNRIVEVGHWTDLRRKFRGSVVDLGNSLLLPGLVNAHCHLDYTAMGGCLTPTRLFTDWLKAITEFKAGWDLEDYRRSWREGADMLARTGTTMVADVEARPDLLPAMWTATPLRMFSFLEMIGITHRRSPAAIVREARQKISSLTRNSLRQAGLSPHAPYSTLPELLRRSAAVAGRHRWRICMHVAESELEHRMFSKAEGPMHEWMCRSGRDMSDCGDGSPLQHAARCGMLNERFIAIHMNYLERGDLPLLQASGAHVVHCPRSHAYFGHRRFPLKHLQAARVNVCLGTDSLASVIKHGSIELDMFAEMRALLQAHPGLSPRTALRMATTAGALALGMQDQVGELKPGALADLIALPCYDESDVFEAAVHHQGTVSASMINGRWAIQPEAATLRAVSPE